LNDLHPILTLFTQIALIVALSRAAGLLFVRLHQPQVMGEMLAGIILGPSVLGWMWPEIHALIFPPESIGYLQTLSQMGVVFFLFLIGLDLDPSLLLRRGKSAVAISASSIAVPFAMGVLLTAVLYRPLFSGEVEKRFLATALFMGAAMSITAFPVLARIVLERNLHRSPVGVLSIACAAVNDLAAWCLLAVVVAIAQDYASPAQAIGTALGAAAYVAVMFMAVRPFLHRLQIVYERGGSLNQNVIAVIFLLILASAYATERIGIHALFGAFVLGFIMPKGSRFVRHLSEKLEDFTVVLLLPLFFAYTGLHTQLALLNSPALLGYTVLIVAVACVGKFGGSALASRLSGSSWREASAIGVLMNTRGLIELVILNIGREMGVIGDRVFAMMVIMAMLTTAMTAPLLAWIYPSPTFAAIPARLRRTFGILVPVSLPSSGRVLARLTHMLIGPPVAEGEPPGRVYALHLRRPVQHEAYRSGLDQGIEGEDPTLAPLLEEARSLGVAAEPITLLSHDVAPDIAAIAEARQVDLVLMGYHKPVLGHTILGGTVHRVLSGCPTHVAILVDRGLGSVARVLVPYLGSEHDRLALALAGRLAQNAGAQVSVLHVVPPYRPPDSRGGGVRTLVEKELSDPALRAAVRIEVVEDASPVDAVVRAAAAFDLVIIGVAEEWGLESHLFGWRAERIAQECRASMLIVRREPRLPLPPPPPAAQPTAQPAATAEPAQP